MRIPHPMLLGSLTLACLGAYPADDPPPARGQRPETAAVVDKNDATLGRPEDVKVLGSLVQAFTEALTQGRRQGGRGAVHRGRRGHRGIRRDGSRAGCRRGAVRRGVR